jgi:hypothetical protein
MTHKDYLNDLSRSLARIHKFLMDYQMVQYQNRTGQLLNPATKLNLLLQDPEFAWLRILSQLMVRVDEVFFQKEPIIDDQVSRLNFEVEELLIRKANDVFNIHFDAMIPHIPELLAEHERLKKSFKTALN